MSFVQYVKEHEASLRKLTNGVRALSMDAVLAAKSGHIGLPLGGAEMGTLLYFAVMKHSSQDSKWIDRDRFVLSAGHGSMLQYSLLHFAGYKLTLDDLKAFRQVGSLTPGHPEVGHTDGVECTTGPLGQGVSNAVGMALAERMLAARFNTDKETLIDHRTYVILGDGCMMEGVTAEAASFAGHMKLSRLICLYDANNITIDGTIDLSFTEDVAKRFEAYGWNILHADGNDFASLANALDKAHANSLRPQGEAGPTLVVCRGIAGKGSPKWEGKHKIHGNPMSAEDVVEAKKHLGIQNPSPFAVEKEWYEAASKLAAKRAEGFEAWQKSKSTALSRWQKEDAPRARLWAALVEGDVDSTLPEDAWTAAKGKTSTRVAGGKALVELAKLDPRFVGGSADLAGSNNTTLPDSSFVNAKDFSGRNIHFGVREHGMAAITNGMALHGGFRPYCATFAVFSDYMRPSIRLAALMNTPSTFILTHDSYAVGEDGPTHQPIEHAAALRAIPNLQVYRTADAFETFAAWQTTALKKQPTALLFSRQDLSDLDEVAGQTLRNRASVMEGMKDGAYLLKDFSGASQLRVTLIASGSEVSIALETAKLLEEKTYETFGREKVRLNVRVVSAPAPHLLRENPLALNRLVPEGVPTVAIEAGSPMGWGEIVGRRGAIFALQRFGMSGPYSKVADELGFCAPKFAQFVTRYLELRD